MDTDGYDPEPRGYAFLAFRKASNGAGIYTCSMQGSQRGETSCQEQGKIFFGADSLIHHTPLGQVIDLAGG